MYIARLLLKGFKSFGGSYDLPLSPGMTAIVGPNGSGKSNLLDALRWVLGDSHASKLRVAKQGGLIFHGSASRAKATDAEVGIQMRDGVRVCTIRRRVSDAGTAATVDGSRVTLAELDAVKREWHLGGDQFAFIGQGDVNEVIQQRPSARRMLLESLFGIDAYRRRRDDASGRLDEAREEFGRLRTFMSELAARRAEIAPQVERAAAAKALIDALDDDRRVMYWARRYRAETMIASLAEQGIALRAAAAARQKWRAVWERSLAYLEGSESELSRTRQEQMRELEDARSTLAGFTKSAYAFGAALTSARRRAAETASDREATAAKVNALREERTKAADADRAIENEIASKRAELEDARARLAEESGAIEAARAAREERLRLIGETDGAMTSLKGRMRSVAESLRALEAEGAGKKISAKDDPTKKIKRELDALEKKYEALLDEQDSAASAHRDIYARLQEVTSDLQKNKREASRAGSKLAELSEQASTEIYPRSVQHVLSASRLGRIKARPVAAIDVFTCEHGLATAIEAFLGASQFNLLVDSFEQANECIELLKKNQMGVATFLPLEQARPKTPDYTYRLPPRGIVGWAAELITVDKKWRPAIEHLMGDLLIVETYADGQSLRRGGFKRPISTLDGEVFRPGGTVSGGRSQKAGRAIELKSALAKLEADAEAARKAVDKLTAEFEKLEADEAAASERKDAIASELRELSSKRSELDAERSELLRMRDRAKNERDSLARELSDGAREYASLASRRRELSAPSESEGAKTANEQLPREIDRLTSELALLEERQRSSFIISDRMAREMRELERAMNELDEAASECDREIVENSSSLARTAKRYAEVASRRRKIMIETREFAERYARVLRTKDRRAARLEAAKTAEADAIAAVQTAERRASELERERVELTQTWEEQFPYPGPESSETFESVDVDALRRSMRERERAIRDLGDVDMGALSEDRSLGERLEGLTSQTDDVRAAMAELERMISEADEQARTIFVRALDEIDKKFCDLFKRLFTGGDAKLEMIEGDTLWESGVDVVARPPGKHPQSISQLSGGEQSLSAIALLFASLEVAECPIAVLDEVDAALDEVNLRRFADLTKEASRDRQIFVMTHRRVTMERADTLYGVTLAEPGLSQVIGVRVEDWA